VSRNALLAAAAVLAALALGAFAVLGGAGGPEPEQRTEAERRPEPPAADTIAPTDLAEAPERVESEVTPAAGDAGADATTDDEADATWRLAVQVVTTEPSEPLAGWRVMLTEVGATRMSALGSEHRVTLDGDGLGVFDDLPRRGPWYVHLGDGRPDDRGFEFVKERLGATSASNDPDAEPVRFEVEPGPRVLLVSALPAGVEPEDLLFRVSAEPSMLSSQMGGLGGVARGRDVPHASAAAAAPRITNSVRGEGAVVDIWSDDGGWWVRERVEGRIENDSTVTVEAPLEPAGRLRFRVARSTGTAEAEGTLGRSQMVLGAVAQLVRQSEGPDPTLPNLGRHVVDLGDGVFEVHGLAPGPVWIDEGAELFGVRLAPLQAQASPTHPAAVTIEVLGLAIGDR